MEQRRVQAKSTYQQGADAYSAGRFKDAVDLFLTADQLAPSAMLSFNIARAYERLGDDAGTLRWYRDYLRRTPNASNAESVRSLITILARSLKSKGVQQATVLTSPVGATVTVDDQPVGITPWTSELSPGKHHLLLSLRGYVDVERDLELAPDTPLDLSVRMAQLSVATAPIAPSLQVVPPPAPPPSAAPGGKKLGMVPWIGLGAGAAALGGALTFELLRRSSETSAKHAGTQLDYQDRLEAEQGRQMTARVFLGVGGALAIAGGVMLLLDKDSSRHRSSAAIACVPRACGITVQGKF